MDIELLGRLAYETYCQETGGVPAVSGARLPDWDDQSEDIRQAWCASADAVRMVIEL